MSVDRISSVNARSLDTKVRMADLARLAGVSVATVSRSLNDSPLINPITKTRVWQLASDHGYVVPADAAALHASRVTVAVMTPLDGEGGTPQLTLALIAAARDIRCNLMFAPLSRNAASDLVSAMARTRADAFVFFDDRALRAPLNDLAGRGDARFIVWGEGAPDSDFGRIGPDNFEGAATAVRHLARQGCRRIAYLGDTDGAGMTQRFMGYLTALNGEGLPIDPALVLPSLDGHAPAFDGVFVADSSRLPHLRTHLPEGARVVAWDDGAGAPAFTTVSLDMAAAARHILSALLGKLPNAMAERLPVTLNIVQ